MQNELYPAIYGIETPFADNNACYGTAEGR